jgi:hypothetical protein
MRKLIIGAILILYSIPSWPQASVIYQQGIASEENLIAIQNLQPYSSGGVGFDNRYEGIRGTSRLFDTLLPSALRIRDQKNYIQVLADIDIVKNLVLFQHPKTKKLMAVPAEFVSVLVMKKGDREILFRTTKGKEFDTEMKETRFFQVLKDGPYQFIKLPSKIFVQADYKGAYAADRRYDEYQLKKKYFLKGPDSVFYQVQLNRKSLLKIYPQKKAIIDSVSDNESVGDKETVFISLLDKF